MKQNQTERSSDRIIKDIKRKTRKPTDIAFIEAFDSRFRPHSAIGNISLAEFL